MKLMDWIDRRPVAVGFGQRGGTVVAVAAPVPTAFDNRAAAAASDLADPAIAHLWLAGDAAAGDGGAALYVRAGAEPGHPGKLQSADGGWWELVAEGGAVSPAQLGGVLADADAAAAGLGAAIRLDGAVAVPASLTLTARLVAAASGRLAPAAGAVLTLAGGVEAGLGQVFDLSAGGGVKLALPQTVRPEWFGPGDTALLDAIKAATAGSTIRLEGRVYHSVAIAMINDPLAADGADTGKVIEGPAPAQRYNTTGAFHGARIRLADGQNDSLFTFASAGANEFGAGGLRNVMLEGNKGANSAGSGVEILNVKDLHFENVSTWNFAEHGWNFNGANNQIRLFGHCESWNNGLMGFRFAAFGDVQGSGALVAVNNGNRGLYFGSGGGRFGHLYAYFNSRGVELSAAASGNLLVDYIRVEDNREEGVFIDCPNFSVNAIHTSDNGIASVTGPDRAGVRLRPGAAGWIGSLSSTERAAAAVRQEEYLLWDESTGGVRIGRLHDQAFDPARRVRTAHFTAPTSRRGASVDFRPARAGTYAALKDAGATITPRPGTWGSHVVTDLTEDATIANTHANAACEGMELAIEVSSAGSWNLGWGSDYLSGAGTALAPTALTAGQTLRAVFRRRGGRWWAEGAVQVA